MDIDINIYTQFDAGWQLQPAMNCLNIIDRAFDYHPPKKKTELSEFCQKASCIAVESYSQS